jgi:hypothetical protein
MNISKLFEEIQNNFESEDLNGEFQLEGNCIVWTYNLNDDAEEISSSSNNDDDEEINYSFDSTSPEELLLEAYNEDYELLTEFLENIEETDNWTFSDPDTGENTITFKIF